jgi:hypothetical protein
LWDIAKRVSYFVEKERFPSIDDAYRGDWAAMLVRSFFGKIDIWKREWETKNLETP